MSKSSIAEPSVDVLTVTPAMAVDMLKKNRRNRRVSDLTVRAYARAMAAGLWNFVGDPLRFNGDGSLLDGQHRLNAVVKSETSQQFVVVSGLPSDSQISMDIGRKRSFADDLRMKGEGYASLISSISIVLIRWQAGLLVHGNLSPSAPELQSFFEDNPAIRRAAEIGQRVRNYVPITPSPVGAVYYRASQINEGAAAEFFGRLADGQKLESGSPILALRNRAIRSKASDERLNSPEVTFLVTRAWNAWRAGEDLHRLTFPKLGLSNKTFPTPH